MSHERDFNNSETIWVLTYGSPDNGIWTKATVFVGQFTVSWGWVYQLDIEGYPDDVNRENGGWWNPKDMKRERPETTEKA